jgi:hypothetical protein
LDQPKVDAASKKLNCGLKTLSESACILADSITECNYDFFSNQTSEIKQTLYFALQTFSLEITWNIFFDFKSFTFRLR